MSTQRQAAFLAVAIASMSTPASYAADELFKLRSAACEANLEHRFAEAEALMRPALPLAEKEGGRRLASCLETLAYSYVGQERIDEAEPLVRRALEIRRQAPRLTQGLGTDYLLLAEILAKRGQLTDAADLIREAVTVSEATSGPGHVNASIAWQTLAHNAVQRKDWGKAEECGKRALAIAEKIPTVPNRHMVNILSMLSQTALGRKQPHDAEGYAKRAIAICERAYEPNDVIIARPLGLLVLAGEMTHRYADVERPARRALEITQAAFGPDDRRIAFPLMCLIRVLKGQGRYAEAEPLLARALPLFESILNPADERLSELLDCYAETLEALKQNARADTMKARAMAIRSKREDGVVSPKKE